MPADNIVFLPGRPLAALAPHRSLQWVLRPISVLLFLALLSGAALSPSNNLPHLATSWLEIRSLADSDLELISNGKSISNQITARALLTQAERNLNRSFPDAVRQLATARGLIEPESDEAAFTNALACQISHRQGRPESHKHCLQLKNLGYEVSSTVVRAYVELSKALYLSREGQHDAASESAKRATELSETSGDPSLSASAHNWLGVQFNIERLPKQALFHYELAWQYAERAPIPELKQVVKVNLASVYSQLDRHDEAVEIYNEALEWPMANVNATRRVVVRSIGALSFIGANQAARAERLLLDVIPADLKAVQPDSAVQAYSSLAQAQLAQGKVDLALQNFERSLEYLGINENPRANAAKVPYAGALRQVGRTTEAQTVLQAVIKELPASSPNELLFDALTELALVYEALGNTKAANEVSAQAEKVSEQLSALALQYQLARMQSAIALDDQHQALDLAKEREEALKAVASRETALRYVSLIIAGLLLAVIYLYFSRRLQTRVMQAERVANEGLEAQVESRTRELESQMADRLKAEVERRHLLSKLAEGEKMRALGQLTAGVAHDFNNLMTAVTLTAEYLKNDSDQSEQSREALLDDILSATDSAASITGGLLAYARQQPLQPKVLQLDEFLEESELIFSNTLGERNLLRTSYEPCSVVVDQGQLASALLNLLLNAKEALGERGTVEISLTVQSDDDSKTATRFAVISVRDSGVGMSESDLQRATEPFFTTKAAGEGTGLGLSMVYGFARQSGGDLTITSKPGIGTDVLLKLPAVPAAIEGDQAEQSVQHLTLPENLRVLVVEDRESVLQMLKLSLEHLGLVVSTASDADEALTSVKELGAPDALLSDIKMPGELDGNQLARMLKSRYPNMPVVMMSGYSETLEDGYEFLHKPFTNTQLEQALLRAIQNAQHSADEKQRA